MKFIDFFSGIGGFRLGMEMNNHECVGHCEIDKFADKSYRAMHDVKEGEWFATDIRTVEPRDLPDADCYCGGFPCQAFSVAGKRGGFEDTRGTLFFEVMRLAAVRKPKYLFLENVAGLLSHNGGKTFGTILNTMGELGYWYEYQVLNSKNHGVPQNRERVFIIGHLGGYSGQQVFPIRQSNEVATREVDGLQDTRQIAGALRATDYKGTHNCINVVGNVYGTQSQAGKLYTTDGLSPTVQGQRVNSQGWMIMEATKKGYAEAHEGDSINLAVPRSETRRGRVGVGVANTLDTSCNQGTLVQGRIRRLTPRECFRLQGFPDTYFDRAAAVNSDSQLYKQAGNSVTVNVIYEIAKRMGAAYE
jgi:DNA (cytosine-5)-methyltransferase 1